MYDCNIALRSSNTELDRFRIMAIEIPGRKRNLNMNINAQQAILNAYITNNSSLYKIYSANVPANVCCSDSPSFF